MKKEKEEKEELVKVTVRMTSAQKELLEKRAARSHVSMAEFVRSLLTKRTLALEPPEEFWDVMEQLYKIHDMLLRIGEPEFTEAAHLLEWAVLDMQEAFTKPQKEAS